jgi:hypothetical protein
MFMVLPGLLIVRLPSSQQTSGDRRNNAGSIMRHTQVAETQRENRNFHENVKENMYILSQVC